MPLVHVQWCSEVAPSPFRLAAFDDVDIMHSLIFSARLMVAPLVPPFCPSSVNIQRLAARVMMPLVP